MCQDKESNQQENPVDTSSKNVDDSMAKQEEMAEFITAVLLIVPPLSRPPLFALGEVVATRGAVDLLDRVGVNASAYLSRHQRGDWGTVCASDRIENDRAVVHRNRILSEYKLGGGRERLWIITEHDRSVTTLLLPSDY
jgi:hypothetical protein